MTTYNIGYIRRPRRNSDNEFVIMAQARCKAAARFIMESYNKAYEENGLSSRVTILTDAELPQEFRFSMDD